LADASKIQGVLLDWKLLDDVGSDNPSVDSEDSPGVIDLGEGIIDVILNITVAHRDANAAATNYVTYRVYGKTGAAEEDWRLLGTGSAGGGTAVQEALDAESASGQAQIKVAAITDWDDGLGQRLFLLDTVILDSEMVTVFGWVDADYYIAANNLAVTHAATTSILHDGVTESPFNIPNGIRYAKVVFSNADDDATYAVRVDYSGVSAFE
jgi:hypothetical protein